MKVLDFEASIVRIETNGEVRGSGFAISDEYVMTCAHVVTDNADRPLQGLAIVFYVNGDRRLVQEVPPQFLRSRNEEDIAVLQFTGQLPSGAIPIKLGSSEDTKDHKCESFGYPSVGSINGIGGQGRIVQIVSDNQRRRLIQISSHQITVGFSGAPLYDRHKRRVIGMITSVADQDKYGRLSDTAFATPAETLRGIYSPLEITDICPYRGLEPFREGDGEFFFGRQALVNELKEHLRRNPCFLAVVGSSASGKSSLVQAGLIPTLRRGDILGLHKPLIVSFRPKDAPYAALREALQQTNLAFESADIYGDLRSYLQKNPDGQLVLFIDQCEELFALCPERQCNEFLKGLAGLLQDSLSFTLIITIRADFYEPLLRSPLGGHLKNGQINTRQMTSVELRETITGPAKLIGAEVQPGLEDRIINDLADTGHSLALLEFALTEVWNRRRDGFLTHEDYEVIGGAAGAIGQWAMKTYSALTPSEQTIARIIFTRLVHYGEGSVPDTRRRLPLSSLLISSGESEVSHQVIKKLADARLVMTDRDLTTGEDVAELIHDALLDEWLQLREWVKEQRPFLIWRQRLQEDMAEWQRLGRDKGALLRGARLSEARNWQRGYAAELSTAEQEYLEESEKQSDLEEKQLKETYSRALARQLVAQAELVRTLQPNNLERSILLAIEAWRRLPSLESDMVLRLALELLPVPRYSLELGAKPAAIALSYDGRYLAAAGADRMVSVRSLQTGSEVLHLEVSTDIREITFNNDASAITASTDDAVHAWCLTDGQRIGDVPLPNGIRVTTLRSDGSLVAGQRNKVLEVWSVLDGRLEARFDFPERISTFGGISFVGERFVVAISEPHIPIGSKATKEHYIGLDGQWHTLKNGGNRVIRIWDIQARTLLHEIPYKGRFRNLVGDDGCDTFFISISANLRSQTIAFNADSGRELWRQPYEGKCAGGDRVALFAPNRRKVGLGVPLGDESAVILCSARSGDEVQRTPILRRPQVLGLSKDGMYLATRCGGMIQLWEAESAREVTRIDAPEFAPFCFGPSASFATARNEGRVQYWSIPPAGAGEPIAHEGLPEKLAFSSTSDILIGSLGWTFYGWRVTDGQLAYKFQYVGPIRRMLLHDPYTALITKQEELVSAQGNRRIGEDAISVREVQSGNEVWHQRTSTPVADAMFDSSGTRLVTGAHDGTVCIWDLSNTEAEPVLTLRHPTAVTSVYFSSKNIYLAAVGQGASKDPFDTLNDLSLWKVEDPSQVQVIYRERGIHGITFEPNDDSLAVIADESVEVFSLVNRTRTATLPHPSRVGDVIFDRNGRVLTRCQRYVYVWQLDHKEKPLDLLEHDSDVWEFVLTGNPPRIVTWTSHTVHVWDLDRRRETTRLTRDGTIKAVALSPDGSRVAVASLDGAFLFRDSRARVINRKS